MTEHEVARLRAEVRALVAENATVLNLAEAAPADVVNRLLGAGALWVGGRVAMPCGTDPIAYASTVFGADPASAHLFRGPDAAAPAMAPKPKPRGLSPSAKLALSNGHEPMFRGAR